VPQPQAAGGNGTADCIILAQQEYHWNQWISSLVFFTITLPLAWPGIMAGLVLSFARALGEFGATLMVAGNIPGQTQTVPLAIYFAVDSGDNAVAGTLVAIITVFSFAVIFWVNRRAKRQKYY